MKYIINVFLLLITTSALAQGVLEETLKNALKYNDDCLIEEETRGDALGVTPSSALKSIHDGKLTYIGRVKLPGSDQNYSCIYKNNSAYVIYNNCMGSKKENNAMEIEVISFKGGINRFYVENNLAGPASKVVRSQYDLNWTIDFVATTPPGDLKLTDFPKFMEKKQEYPGLGVCFIGSTFKAKDPGQKSDCTNELKNKAAADKWKADAKTVWDEPGSDWYDALKLLRKTVIATKF